MVGKTVRLDENTLQQLRGRYARLAVEVDLSSPLRTIVELDGELMQVQYKGLPQLCFQCGKVDHATETCSHCPHGPSETPVLPRSTGETVAPAPVADVGVGSNVVPNFGPWVQIHRARRPPSQRSPLQARFQRPSQASSHTSPSKFGSRYAALTDTNALETQARTVDASLRTSSSKGLGHQQRSAPVMGSASPAPTSFHFKSHGPGPKLKKGPTGLKGLVPHQNRAS
ncbi:hypothetical protein K2173_016843 [Erythroxylum novogranatense]|uniref:CCHC-type domain-containing protein n=1 Tax=Erythroxylum novogranatense TaxID=1862640 RepID=A0AAV8SHW4_9ROSI|nr:hypothetical protein K2173_016843 [Erythroxylum novogranatense]